LSFTVAFCTCGPNPKNDLGDPIALIQPNLEGGVFGALERERRRATGTARTTAATHRRRATLAAHAPSASHARGTPGPSGATRARDPTVAPIEVTGLRIVDEDVPVDGRDGVEELSGGSRREAQQRSCDGNQAK
jgi:hypothetical protein